MRSNHAESTTHVRRLSFERLEMRLPLAVPNAVGLSSLTELLAGLAPDQQSVLEDFLANRVQQTVASPSAEIASVDAATEVVRLRLVARNDSPEVGDTFSLDIYVKEFADQAGFHRTSDGLSGLFQAQFDLQYDAGVVEPIIDQVFLNERFLGRPKLSDDSGGVLRYVGGYVNAYSGSSPGALTLNEQGEFLLTTIPFRVISTGDALITPLPASSGESFLVFGSDTPIPTENVTLPSLSLKIVSAPEEPPANAPPIAVDRDPVAFALVPLAGFDRVDLPDRRHHEPFTLISLRTHLNDAKKDRETRISKFEIPKAADDDETKQELELDDAKRRRNPSTTENDDEKAVRFWRDYNFSLLDDEAAKSLFELHFRSLRLRLANDGPMESKPSVETKSNVESVIDAGMVDISVWLSNPAYRSWKPDPHPVVVDNAINDATLSDQQWQPSGKTASLRRLETAGEVGDDAARAQADLFRRFADDVVDAKTEIPESEAF